MEDKINEQLIQLVNQLEKVIYEPLFDQEYVDKNKAWDYVCYDFRSFITHLQESHLILDKKENLKFLDVGCGIGSKVHLSKILFDGYGIELNENYHKVATEVNTPREFFKFGRYENKQDKKRIFKTDALNFNYKPYDVIYFFRPINEIKLQQKLEKQIFETIRPGTIVIPIYSQSTFPNYIRHLPTPSDNLYIKLHNDNKFKKMEEKIKQLFKTNKPVEKSQLV